MRLTALRPAKTYLLGMTCLAVLSITPAAIASEECTGADFPTAVITDYVLGCMAANGNQFETLHQCSCSIDLIKSRMSYDAYEQAQTVLRARRDQGQRGVFFRDSNWAKRRVEVLEKAQAESTLRCF